MSKRCELHIAFCLKQCFPLLLQDMSIYAGHSFVIYVIKTVMKFHLKKIDTSFHQPLPNMVQRLFADVINDAIWFMNMHEQNHP
jgi:hypothetical protein